MQAFLVCRVHPGWVVSGLRRIGGPESHGGPGPPALCPDRHHGGVPYGCDRGQRPGCSDCSVSGKGRLPLEGAAGRSRWWIFPSGPRGRVVGTLDLEEALTLGEEGH